MAGTYDGLQKDGRGITYGGWSNQIVVPKEFVLPVSDNFATAKYSAIALGR